MRYGVDISKKDIMRFGMDSTALPNQRGISHLPPLSVSPIAPLARRSAPTDDGRAFIEQYAGSRKFLVYE